jgi:predicted NUDIX family NTP pyrophosphohydrolase
VRAVFDGEERYLVVHPSGAYSKRSLYSIPKGELEEGEDEATAALRETRERPVSTATSSLPRREPVPEESKVVIAFLAEPSSPPPGTVLEPGDWEIDRAEFLPAEEARARLHPDQQIFIDRALALREG